MKRKHIEKIPYITVPAVVAEAGYVAVTAWKNIGKERHIFLEVYRNRPECLAVPVVRYAATRKDWGVYFPDAGTWTRQGIKANTWNAGPCWYDRGETSYENPDEREKKNQLYSQEDMERIENFFGKDRVWGYCCWWDYFGRNENSIKNASRDRKYRKRMDELAEREKNTPELPEKEILDWAETALFHGEHYLYYRRKGSRAAVCCTKCGGVREGRWRAGQSYKSQFAAMIEEPRKGHTGKCTLCGAYGRYKPQGEVKGSHKKEGCVFMADRYKETGALVRYVELRKEWNLEEFVGKNGAMEMLGAYERLSGVEVARAYFVPGRKVQIDFHKRSCVDGRDFWDDCNLYGMNNISIENAVLYPGMGEKLKGTCLQYSAIELYSRHAGKANAVDYLKRYQEMPQIEMLVKAGLYGVVERLVRCHCEIVKDSHAARPDEFLGIRKERVKFLAGEGGSIELLSIMQAEKTLGQNWREEQMLALREIGADFRMLEMITGIMTVQKALNLISKYAGCRYGTGCRTAEARLRHTATTYFDYLEMRKELGYDLGNTVYQRPRDLERAHARMVEEKDMELIEKRIREIEGKYPGIRKRYRSLRKKYYYEDETYVIRPARSAEEIVKEGRILHHCVGRDTYLEKHNRGYSTILLLRPREKRDVPYITVEIAENRIVQWYGAYDKKPDEKNMQKWLDSYIAWLECAGEAEVTEDVMVMAG